MDVVYIEGKVEPAAEAQNNAVKCGDPVYLYGGQFAYECHDLSVPGRKMDVDLGHMYSSGDYFNGPFGYGWFLNYHKRLHTLQSGDVVIVDQGRKTRYTLDSGTTYHPPAGRFEILKDNGDGTWTLSQAHGEEFTFNGQGLLASIQDRNGNTTSLYYSTQQEPVYGYPDYALASATKILTGMDYRLEEIHGTNGRIIELTYNTDGLLETITENGRDVEFVYDTDTHDLLTVTKPATTQYPSGVTKTFEYADHRVKKIKDAENQYFVENFYDTEGRVEEQDLGGESMFFDYSVPGETTFTDRNGNITTYTFNSTGNVIEEETFTKGLRTGEPSSYVTNFTYNADSLKTSVTYPDGNGAKFTYDDANTDPRSRGNLLEVRRKTSMAAPDDNNNDIVIAMTYESSFNQPKTVTDARGEVTTYLYDYELDPMDPKYGLNGNLVKVTFPTVTAGTPAVEYDYNAYGQVTEIEDANGNITQFSYGTTTGYLESITRDPSGINAVTAMTYDGNGYMNTVTDAEGKVTDYDYDALGWLNQVTTDLGFATKYIYDANGNVTSIERQADSGGTSWQTTYFTYDVLNNLKTVLDPASRLTTYNYDNNENLASVVDAELNTTAYVYDERNKLFTVTDANSGVTRYDYDDNGNLAKIIDAEDNETTYIYDGFDRLFKETYDDASFHEYAYDKNGNRISHDLPSADTIELDYDDLNRLIARRYLSTSTLNVSYDYDLGSRLTDVDTTAADIHYTYDALDRIATATQMLNSVNYVVEYDYFKNGQLKSIEYPSTKLVEYTYDDDNRIDLVKVNATTIADYTFDTLGRLTTRAYPVISKEAAFAYDSANQLTAVTNGPNGGTAFSDYAYTGYDDVGNRTQFKITQGGNPQVTIDYAYNDIYELTGVSGAQSHSYTYDSVGNRDTVDPDTYSVNTINQYTALNSTNFSYDSNGNLTNDGLRTLTYDEDNRLTSASYNSVNSSYAYDGLGRRVKKTVGSDTTYYVYDGDDVIAEYDGTGSLIAEYVTGFNIDEVLTMDRNSATYYYFYDGLGSVRDIISTSGTVVEYYEYDPYGTVEVFDGSGTSLAQSSGIDNPHMFTARHWDEESGLYHYRARAYEPTIGRFLQRDPLGYVDSMNLYAYVINNPANLVDPTGEAIPVVVWLIAGGVVGAGTVDVGLQVAENYLTGQKPADIDYGEVAVSSVLGGIANAAGIGLFQQGSKGIKAFKQFDRARKNFRARQIAMKSGKVRNAQRNREELLKRNKAFEEVLGSIQRGSYVPILKRLMSDYFENDGNDGSSTVCQESF